MTTGCGNHTFCSRCKTPIDTHWDATDRALTLSDVRLYSSHHCGNRHCESDRA